MTYLLLSLSVVLQFLTNGYIFYECYTSDKDRYTIFSNCLNYELLYLLFTGFIFTSVNLINGYK